MFNFVSVVEGAMCDEGVEAREGEGDYNDDDGSECL